MDISKLQKSIKVNGVNYNLTWRFDPYVASREDVYHKKNTLTVYTEIGTCRPLVDTRSEGVITNEQIEQVLTALEDAIKSIVNPISLDGLIKFQLDRDLHKQTYSGINEATNTLEELLEGLGYDVPKANRSKLRGNFELFIKNLEQFKLINKVDLTEEDIVDSIADEVTFAIGKLLKLGYDPYKVIEQVSLEINSRTGNIINGKFEKDLSVDARAKWVKADYTKCKI